MPETRFSPPLAYIPMEGYCYWIDEDMKKETLEAMRKGETFDEVERVIDDYQTVPTTNENEELEGEEEL